MKANINDALTHLRGLKEEEKKREQVHKLKKNFNNTIYSYKLKRNVRYNDLLASLKDGYTLQILNYKDEDITQFTLGKINKRFDTKF